MVGVEQGPQVVRRPLVAAALAFVAGAKFPGEGSAAAAVLALGLFGLLVALLARNRRILSALLLPLGFFLAGRGGARVEPPTVPPLPEWVVEGAVFEGLIAAGPFRGPEGSELRLELTGVAPGPVPAALQSTGGRARLRMEGAVSCGRPGDRIRVFARSRPLIPARAPGGFDRQAWAARSGFDYDLRAAPGACSLVLVSSGANPRVWLPRLRFAVQEAIDQTLDGASAGLVRALATGDRAGLPRADREAIRDAGLSHLTAVSGFHLGVLAWLMGAVALAVLRRWPRVSEGFGATAAAAALTLPAVALYPVFVGLTPSAVRAGCMLGVVLAGQVLHRGAEIWSALAAALLVMAAVDPSALADPGLQLSFVAVAALLRLPKAFERALGLHPERWKAPLRWLWTPFVASTAATLGTLPVLAHHFGTVSVVGLLTNVPAGLLAAVAVPLSLLGGLVAVVQPDLGAPLLHAAGGCGDALLFLARVSRGVPNGVLPIPSLNPVCIGAFVVLVTAFVKAPDSRAWRRCVWAALAVLAAGLAWTPIRRSLESDTRVSFLPVGQGDGAVIELPHGKVMVVDAGPRGAGRWVLLPFLRERGIRQIDVFVATHPHADHIGGLPELLEAMEVREIWWTGDQREGPADILAAITGHPGARVVGPGVRYESGEAEVRVLGPGFPPHAVSDVNDASVVLRLEHGRRALLLTGDAEVHGEASLVESSPPGALRADVLKAGHHGSRSSSTVPFLARVRPAHVILSLETGNGFGFPHREALERLDTVEPVLWRTDRDGAIEVRTDGESMQIEGYLRSEAEVTKAP